MPQFLVPSLHYASITSSPLPIGPARQLGRFGAGLLMVGLLVSTALAAPKPSYLFPAGATQGETVSVQIGGELPQWPVEVWVDREGLDVKAEEEKGKLLISSDAGAEPGIYWLRLYDESGASPLQPFLLETLPEAIEAEENDGPSEANPLELPVTVNGRLDKREDVDGFMIPLKRGQTLVAALRAAQLLGSPMDGVLQVCDEQGFVLQQNDDARGLDPQVLFTAPYEGRFLVRLFAFPETPTSSIAFASGANYVYRLTLSAGPLIDACLPLSLKRGESRQVTLEGYNIAADQAKLTIQAPDSEGNMTAWHPQMAWWVALPCHDYPAVSFHHDSSSTAPADIEIPISISAKLDEPKASGRYRFSAKADQELQLRVESDRLGYELDALLVIRDQEGKILAQADDQDKQRDPVLNFTPPADGHYIAEVGDLHQYDAARHVYRLTILPLQSDYELTLEQDVVAVKPGESAELAVTIDRQNGFEGEVRLEAAELPKGVTLEATVAPLEKSNDDKDDDRQRRRRRGQQGQTIKVKITASPEATSGPFRIVGHADGLPNKTAQFQIGDRPFHHSAAWVHVSEP